MVGSPDFTKSGISMVLLQVFQQQNRSKTIYTGVYLFFWFGFFFGINLANKASKALCDALTIFVHPFIVDSLALKVYTA